MENTKDKTSIWQFLPYQLEPLTHGKKTVVVCEKTGKYINLKNAMIIDFMHDIIRQCYFKKKKELYVCSLISKDRYGSNYNHYITYLCDMGYIRQTGKHRAGEYSRRYQISNEIFDQEMKRYRNSDTILLKKRKKINDELISTGIPGGILPEVKEKMVNDAKLVKIDSEASMMFLNAMTGKENHLNAYNKNKYCVEVIKSGDLYCHFDDYGRMHTNFTVLKKHIRQNYLTINGETLTELDIENSQPLFLMKVLEESPKIGVDEDEFKLFKLLTTSAKFYQYIMSKSNIKDKDKVKKLVYTVFFGKNNQYVEYNKVFLNLFPTIFEFIMQFKNINKSVNAKDKTVKWIKSIKPKTQSLDDYKKLAHQLQRSESNLIYNIIIKEIMTKHPQIPIITIHDSIMFPKRYKEVVEEIFRRNIKEAFNIA